MTDKIKLLEQWRDWHWHMALYYWEQKDIQACSTHKLAAETFHKAYRVMIGNLQSAPTTMRGYEGIVYGEYPE